MASAQLFVCSACSFSIQDWDEGNPFYIDSDGIKRYAYHPSRERDLCTGNDPSCVCLDCGAEFKAPSTGSHTCPSCQSVTTTDTHDLEGKTCPKCKDGIFKRNEHFFVIS